MGWIDDVDFEQGFPGEPLVPVGLPHPSPYDGDFRIDYCRAKLADRDIPYYGTLLASDKLLLESGPSGVEKPWRSALGSQTGADGAPLMAYRPSSSYRDRLECNRLPTMVGVTPVAGALYLAAIGKTDKRVPLRFARALLNPKFSWPEAISALPAIEPPPLETFLSTLWVDAEHRLTIYDQPVASGYGGHLTLGEPVYVLSEGWRRRGQAIFLGRDADDEPESAVAPDTEFDYDGEALVRLRPRTDGSAPNAVGPIKELSEYHAELGAMFNEIRADVRLLDRDARDRHWPDRPATSSLCRRIVESALRWFTPRPHHFRKRTGTEVRPRSIECDSAVVALFDRLLDAPAPLRPTDLVVYFFSLIRKPRRDWQPWAEELAGVWGFKIKTGDHNWIEGRIWHEPDRSDDPADPVEFTADRQVIGSRGHRDLYRHSARIRTGSLRCSIWRDDT